MVNLPFPSNAIHSYRQFQKWRDLHHAELPRQCTWNYWDSWKVTKNEAESPVYHHCPSRVCIYWIMPSLFNFREKYTDRSLRHVPSQIHCPPAQVGRKCLVLAFKNSFQKLIHATSRFSIYLEISRKSKNLWLPFRWKSHHLAFFRNGVCPSAFLVFSFAWTPAHQASRGIPIFRNSLWFWSSKILNEN